MKEAKLEQTAPLRSAQKAAELISNNFGVEEHQIALTLGSGWAKAAEQIGETVAEIQADQVPGFGSSGIPGHTGTIRSIRMPNGNHALVFGCQDPLL